MRKLTQNVLTGFVLLLCKAILVFAQLSGSTTGYLIGNIKDIQDSTISGANVSIENLETNFKRTITSNQKGVFSFLNLTPGKYKVSVEAEGFAKETTTVVLNVGVTGVVDFVLSPSSSREAIEINASDILTEQKIENSTNIARKSIEELPINRRNYLDFSTTSARVIIDRLPNTGISATSGLSFNGQSGRVNNFTIDGLDNNDRSTGSVRAIFGQDSIREYQIVGDGYSAEFGRSLGGVVNVVTRNGTNSFQGNLFFLNRNDKISARDVFTGFKPPFSQTQFGLQLGGAISKAFYFLSFERLTQKKNNIVTISDEIVAAARRQHFPINNGIIPVSLGTTSLLSRVDFKVSPNNMSWARYNGTFSYDGAFQSFGGLTADSSGAMQFFDSNDLAFNNTYINPNQNLVNETRFLFARLTQNVLSDVDSPQVQLSSVGGRNLFGRFFLLPQTRQTYNYQFVDNITFVNKNLTTKIGVDLQYLFAPKDKLQIAVAPKGILTFSELDFSALFGVPNLPTLSAIQALDNTLRTPQQLAFLKIIAPLLPNLFPGFPKNVPVEQLPIPLSYIQGFGNSFPAKDVKSLQLSAFAQEDLKIKSSLLIKFGVRYDLNKANFSPDNNGNFSPRIGFAYHQKGTNLTLRSSYGLFFGVPLFATNILANLITQDNRYNILVLPIPFATVPFTLPGRSIPQGQDLPISFKFVPQLSQTFSTQKDLRNSYTQQMLLALDYRFKRKILFSLAYDSVRGIKLFSVREVNPVVRPLADPINSFVLGRSNPSLGSIMQGESAFDSYYYAITFSSKASINNKIELLASYTYSKAIDNTLLFTATDTRVIDLPNNTLDIGNERGLSVQDLRHRFVLSSILNINFNKKFFLRDYQLSVITNFNSGRPYNLLTNIDLNKDGDSGDRPDNLGRNVGITPGFASTDIRLQRIWKIKNFNVQTFVECFNLFNRKNIDPNQLDRIFALNKEGKFDLPKKIASRYTIGQERFRGALPPRQIQLGLRISF